MPSYIRYHRDPEKHKAQRRASYQRNKESQCRRARERYGRNQLREILRQQQQRARAAAVDAELTPQQWLFILGYYGHCCAYTGESPNGEVLQLDHLVPLSAGGRHALGNVVPALPAINQGKKDRELVGFLTKLDIDVDEFLDRLEECTRAWEDKEDERRRRESGVPEYDIDEHYNIKEQPA